MRICFKIFVITVSLIFVSCKSEKDDAGITDKKPNILYIMSDDHSANAVGVYGSRLAILNPTPTIDALANQGMVFENCFANSSICTPSRASILTGQYPQTNGVLELRRKDRGFQTVPHDKQYLPIEMKTLGYETAMIGKWHLYNEPASFDYYCVLPVQGEYFDPSFRVRGTKEWGENTIQKEGHSSDVITDITLEWLKNKRDNSKPFFMMHHFKAPHDMYEFAPRYESYLEDVEIPEPASLYHNGNNGSEATRGKNDSLIHLIGSSISKRNTYRDLGNYGKKVAEWDINQKEDNKELRTYQNLDLNRESKDNDYTHRVYQEYLKRYLRCVKGIDDNIKRIVDYLDESGELDNTIIIYTSDQGQMLGEHDYQDKRWMYEESMRMPFIVSYPKDFKKGVHSDAIINNTYFAPTIIELAGGAYPQYMQGHSFKKILETGEELENWPQATYYRYWMHMWDLHHNPAHFGIRTKRYKLIFFYGKDHVKSKSSNKNPDILKGQANMVDTPAAWEFYDLEKDPKELDNRYDDEKYQDVIKVLKQQLLKLREDLNETDKNYPEIQKIIDVNWDK